MWLYTMYVHMHVRTSRPIWNMMHVFNGPIRIGPFYVLPHFRVLPYLWFPLSLCSFLLCRCQSGPYKAALSSQHPAPIVIINKLIISPSLFQTNWVPLQVLSRTHSYQTNGMISRACSSGYKSWLRPTECTLLCCSFTTIMREDWDVNKNHFML